MLEYLFQEPLSALLEQKLREARAQGEQLTLQQLESPDLATTLQKIATFRFDTASLKPDQRRGKRRTEKQKRMDYGREIVVNVDFIDVSIPFEGAAKSFRLAPSHRKIVDTPVTVTTNNMIQISVPDDQNLEQKVNFFIQTVTENLSTLEKELQRIEPQMLQAAQLAANQRLEQIRERRERDKTRSFPIE
jgi:hypothetical protein